MSSTKLSTILFCSAIWNFTRLLVNTIIIFIFASFVFNVPFSLNLFPAITVLFLAVTALSGIGMMSAGMIIAFKLGDPINWFFATLTGLLSGVFFPIEVLPSFLQRVALLLPATYALLALRQTLILNAPVVSIISHIAMLALFSLVTIPAGFLLFKWGFNKARMTGSLAQY
jgi:ABC-2 type transport system permease protein